MFQNDDDSLNSLASAETETQFASDAHRVGVSSESEGCPFGVVAVYDVGTNVQNLFMRED